MLSLDIRLCLGTAQEIAWRFYIGIAMGAKRLEKGTYAMPFPDSGEVRREITAQELGRC
jgi:hypothetical protein